jgi:hypothetical protein
VFAGMPNLEDIDDDEEEVDDDDDVSMSSAPEDEPDLETASFSITSHE